jgi:hypothetical protein
MRKGGMIFRLFCLSKTLRKMVPYVACNIKCI